MHRIETGGLFEKFLKIKYALKSAGKLYTVHPVLSGHSKIGVGAQWLSGRVLDLRLRGCGFEPHWHHCDVSLSKNISHKVMVLNYLCHMHSHSFNMHAQLSSGPGSLTFGLNLCSYFVQAVKTGRTREICDMYQNLLNCLIYFPGPALESFDRLLCQRRSLYWL